jgi:uncharacterized protein YecE (DUF72 family)
MSWQRSEKLAMTGVEPICVGCAGWTIPRTASDRFPRDGTHLQRYAQRLPAAEINSSFYRPHKPATYARWADSVPDYFRFAVKVPKALTHRARLRDADATLERFLSESASLGEKRGPLLVQLPPSLGFEKSVAETFFDKVRKLFAGSVVCEPRHASWFADSADALLFCFRIARVAADPPPHPRAADPGGWQGLVYYRWHGAPTMYHSSYSDRHLDRLAAALRVAAAPGAPAWCIFDNTAEGAAAINALALLERLA